MEGLGNMPYYSRKPSLLHGRFSVMSKKNDWLYDIILWDSICAPSGLKAL